MRRSSVRGRNRSKSPVIFGSVLLAVLCLFLARSGLWRDLAAAVCDFNRVCSYEEWSSKSTPANQPCLDCRPKVYAPLVVGSPGAQIVTQGNNTSWSKYKIFQFRATGTEIIEGETVGTYEDTWASLKTETDYPCVWAGDADNDGHQEIAALLSSGKGKKIAIYESGSFGSPSWESPYFAKSAGNIHSLRVGDADNDGRNELVMDIGDRVWIYRVVRIGSSYEFTPVWTSPSYGKLIWTMDIGDADNAGDNEIILAVFSNGAPIVLKHGDGTWLPQPIEQLSPAGSIAIDVAKVRDVDEYPGNEILGSGNNKKVMVWKHDGSVYKLNAISQDLGGFTQGVDSGEIDPTLAGNEIATAASSAETVSSTGYLLKCSQGLIEIISSVAIPRSSDYVCAKDLDGDGICEIGISIYPNGLEIYEFLSSSKALLKRMSCVFGCCFEASSQR